MLLPFLLLAILQQANAASPPVWPVEWIADHCPEFHDEAGPVDVTACRVTESGEIGSFSGNRYFYAFYCVEQRDFKEAGACSDPASLNGRHPRGNVAVFAGRVNDSKVRPINSQLGIGGDFRIPQIVANDFGLVMELGLVLAATCDCNASSYYLQRPGTERWQPLDWDTWQRELAGRLPAGLRNWNTFWPDLRNMTTEGPLWRAEDAHCCPTGGSVHVRLTIANDAFVLQSFEVSRDLPQPQ